MSVVNASADKVERQEDNLLPPVAFNLQRGIESLVKIGGIHMDGDDFIINALQGFDRTNNAAANREHDFDEAGPAAAVWRPPAELPTIPGSHARFIERRIKMNSTAKALRRARCIIRHVLRKLWIEVGAIDPPG